MGTIVYKEFLDKIKGAKIDLIIMDDPVKKLEELNNEELEKYANAIINGGLLPLPVKIKSQENYNSFDDILKNAMDNVEKEIEQTLEQSIKEYKTVKQQSWQSQCEQKGDITELTINAKLRKYGRISIPYGDAPYDVILQSSSTNKMVKIQSKHGKLTVNKSGSKSITFSLTDRNGNKYSNNDVDVFAVYSTELEKAWLIPYSKVSDKTQCTLNLTSTTRSQGLPAGDFDFEKQITKITS